MERRESDNRMNTITFVMGFISVEIIMMFVSQSIVLGFFIMVGVMVFAYVLQDIIEYYHERYDIQETE